MKKLFLKIRIFFGLVDWDDISKYQKLSEKFIKKYKDKELDKS